MKKGEETKQKTVATLVPLTAYTKCETIIWFAIIRRGVYLHILRVHVKKLLRYLAIKLSTSDKNFHLKKLFIPAVKSFITYFEQGNIFFDILILTCQNGHYIQKDVNLLKTL